MITKSKRSVMPDLSRTHRCDLHLVRWRQVGRRFGSRSPQFRLRHPNPRRRLQHEALRHESRIARKEQPDVDLLAIERRDRERSTCVQRLEVFEGDAICVLEAELTERTLWALGRPAEDQSVADRRQVTQLLQILRAGGRLRHDEAVLVGRRGVVEDGETLWIECFLETDLGRLRIRGRLSDLPVLVDEGEERREVLGVDIDLAGLDRGLDELTVPEVEFPCDLVPVCLEYLAVELAERDLLVEV